MQKPRISSPRSPRVGGFGDLKDLDETLTVFSENGLSAQVSADPVVAQALGFRHRALWF